MTAPVDLVLPELTRLVACVCTALDASLAGSVCRCSSAPSADIIADFCGGDAGCTGCSNGRNGQATVGVSRIYPVTEPFPTQLFESTPCAGFAYAADFSITVLRCAPGAKMVGNKLVPPTAAQLDNAAAIVLSDAAAVRDAVLCCFPLASSGMCTQQVILTGWDSLADGDCMGGTTTVTAAIGYCGCPESGDG